MRPLFAYQLNWFDAHIWSYAEYYGLPEILTEDLQHDRLYGTVRAVNPFLESREGPASGVPLPNPRGNT